ncbi:glycosyl transferase family 4 [Tenacibaculum adriaticum]|uniref:Glycosyl transferase family 4 n=1 Tax=Tenacibaculum adriaticum TaxID=413713 RepID=A0A5S5DN75_9FLAO|nr:glycosyltransferase family 4 protein [Tenacibaculum adriaticum]TYP96496.1 glycosyl transferase family 4 [Tenacibaculum adriaticum]
MKVLIITYYWPPAGGSGVQRWLKFVKYLPQFGITPVVYVPKNADYPTIDEKLLEEIPDVKVLKQPVFNPQDIFPNKKNKKTGVANISKGGFLSWIRGNFFIPDPKIFWVKPSVKYLKKYISENEIDLIISSGPPHSMHLIAEKLKVKTNIKWIADFRDPWTTLYYAEDFNLSNFAKQKNEKLEQKILQNADIVLTVSNTLKEEFLEKTDNVEVITNGFDDEVFVEDNSTLDKKFSISHIGLLPKQSNPKILWEVLSEIAEENIEFKNDLEISLTGNVCDEAIISIKKNRLEDNLKLNGYVSHNESIELQKMSQILLLLIPNTKNSKGILTGKLFEYLTAKRPILAIGPEDGDLATILAETNSGTITSFENKMKLKEQILKLYDDFSSRVLSIQSNNIEQFHRKNLTEKLAKIIKNLIQQ